MSVIRRNTCSTCAYKVGAGGEFYCRFNPPVAHPVFTMTPKGPQMAGQVSVFPKVDPGWWCGQFSGLVLRAESDNEPRVTAN